MRRQRKTLFAGKSFYSFEMSRGISQLPLLLPCVREPDKNNRIIGQCRLLSMYSLSGYPFVWFSYLPISEVCTRSGNYETSLTPSHGIVNPLSVRGCIARIILMFVLDFCVVLFAESSLAGTRGTSALLIASDFVTYTFYLGEYLCVQK